ncbi:E3 ubiquitin-protein ligase RNF139-like [Mya arenaria]|uniref:E3 ubiquitin-protein ligase RNF139-like n=1 Tax=Mya arenaria TaxID=6604 RepID=UPI0022E0FCBD|nr:E3 ubiquitin-protein ligase RNF139-like [Mya arenaria]
MAKTIRTFCDFLNGKSLEVDSKLSEYGSYVDDWYDGLTGRKKYKLEVTLKFPLVVIMYLWMNGIAPYYNNWLLDAPFLIVRYLGLFVILVRFISSFENLFPFYVATCTVYVSSVVSQYVYWISRSAAEEACFPEAFGPCWSAGDHLWIPTTFAIVVRVLCMFQLLHDADDAVLMVVPLVSSLITLLMSLTSWYIVAEVDYLTNGFFLIISLVIIILRCEENEKSSVYKKLLKLRGQLEREEDSERRTRVNDLLEYYEMKKQRIDANNWNVRLTKDVSDLITAIFTIFSMMSILMNLSTRLWSLLYNSDKTYLELNNLIEPIFSSLSESSNNCITFIGLAFVFGKLSHILIYAINTFLNVAQPNFDNLRYQVEIFFMLVSVEGGIISVDSKTRERNLEGVLLMTMFQIFLHTLGRVENEILALANAGGRTSPMRLVKLGLVLATITIGPTFFVTTHATPALHVNVWHLFNLTGNLTLLVRVFFLLLECFLLWISWHLTQLNDNIQRVLNIVRVIKGISMLTSNLLMTYYRLMAPFLVAFFWLRVVLNIVWATFGIIGIIYIEWAEYKNRNDLLDFISGLPNASTNEDNAECSVCYIEMDVGKKLPCGHVFHHDCLKRWFQVRNVCPYCNTAVDIPRRMFTTQGLVAVNQNPAGIEQQRQQRILQLQQQVQQMRNEALLREHPQEHFQ